MSKLEAYYGLPSKVKYCKKCVISNQRPSSTVEFKNEKGEKKKLLISMIKVFAQPAFTTKKKKRESIGMIGRIN